MLRLQFETDNAVFDDNPTKTMANILRNVARAVEATTDNGEMRIVDVNGNTIGHAEWRRD